MNPKVALIDFPRLQEQIATRVLAEHSMNADSLTYQEARERLARYNLALFFWPESGKGAPERLNALTAEGTEPPPVMIVTSELGRRNAEVTLGRQRKYPFLTTPLQSQIMGSALHAVLGTGRRPAAEPGHLDVSYVNPFISATLTTLQQMANMQCRRTSLEVRRDASSSGHISGVIALSGKVDGFVAITCPDRLARLMVTRMLQIAEGEETAEDIMDGVGEVMNMIAGAAKAELVDTSKGFQLGIPNVIVGGPHNLGHPRIGAPVVVIGFEAEGEPLEVMVCMRERPPEAAH